MSRTFSNCILGFFVLAASIGGVSLPAAAQATGAVVVLEKPGAAQRTMYTIPHSFSRYASPDECVQAAVWAEQQFWRDKRPDTVYRHRGGNAYQPSTVDSVRACLKRFSLETVAQRDLVGFGQAALAAERPNTADSAFAKLAGTTAIRTASSQNAWALLQIVQSYLEAARPDVIGARRYLTRLDALGPGGAGERLLGYAFLAKDARRRDSVSLETDALTLAIRAMKDLSGDHRKEFASISASVYGAMADLKSRKGNVAGAVALISAAENELVPLRPSLGGTFQGMLRGVELVGKAAPQVQATRWFNAGTSSPARPARGRPALIVFGSHACEDECYPGYAVLRRLAAKYSVRELDITIVARTRGFVRNQLVDAETEMTKIQEHFVNYHKLPVTVAVWKTDFGKRDDGQLLVLSAPNEQAYRPNGRLSTFVVDKEGIVRMASTLSSENEAVLEDMIQSLL